MIKVFQNFPCRFLNLIAGKNHVNAGFDGIFNLDGQDARMPVQILRFTLKTVKPVCVL